MRGFTLVELMMTVAIAGVLMALAVPAMQHFVTQKAVSTISDELVSALRYARTESLKRSSPVTVCAGNGQTTAAAVVCSSDWTKGWIVFADRDGDGSYTAASDELLRVEQAIPQQVVGPTASPAAGVRFVQTGMAVTGAQSFTFKPNLKSGDSNLVKFTRTVCVNAQGRVNVVSGSTSCN